MNVPFLDLQRQYAQIKSEIDGAIQRVVDRQFFILGEELASFETEFASYLGTEYVVGVGSGTDALMLALRALGIGTGDEVITQPNSFIATTLAITEIGATPVFVDIDSDTYQIDVRQIESKITKKTKAILPVHIYGAPCEIDTLMGIAKKHHLFVVEDACQAHGATYHGKKVGTFGDVSAFSFYPGKNLGAYGDGGALCTDNPEIYAKLLKLRNYGQSRKYFHDEIGINTRLDEIQAAVLRVKLKYLDEWNDKRNLIAQEYRDKLTNVHTQQLIEGAKSNHHIFIVQVSKRDGLLDLLKQHGIHALIHYPIPIHLQKCYTHLDYMTGKFPVTELLSAEALSLPIFPELLADEIAYVIKTLNGISFNHQS
ncbi:MAG: DegT/DnrJ/EryC1/StrS family aminotransferase [Candidatus Thermoplasmatota archaeon]